jgi:hypothetical protein
MNPDLATQNANRNRKRVARIALLGIFMAIGLVVAVFNGVPRPLFINAASEYFSLLVTFAGLALLRTIWSDRLLMLHSRSAFINRWARFGGINNSLLAIVGVGVALGAAPWLELPPAAMAMRAGLIATAIAFASAVVFRIRIALKYVAMTKRVRVRSYPRKRA